MKVYFATRVRGFFKHLFAEPDINAEIYSAKQSIYELNTKKQAIIRHIAKLSIFDLLGIIRVEKAQNKDCDLYGSFNRFLHADKPYFIYVENPTALYHYRINRGKSLLGKRKLKRHINSAHLKAFVCMSQACYKTFERLCGEVPKDTLLTQIYPLVPNNPYVNKSYIEQRTMDDAPIKLLYIAQGIRFISKGALEIVEAYKHLRDKGYRDISLTMVTSFSDVKQEILNQIKDIEGLTLLDFTLSNDEIQKLYAEHTIFLMPTSDDSFNLTVLEAIKAGLPVIGCSLYAIPEMVEDSYNGYLTDPAYDYFDKDCMPNPYIWSNQKKTIYSGNLNQRVKNFLLNKIEYLYKNRDALLTFSENSYDKSHKAPFSQEYIVEHWNNIFKEIVK